MSYAPASNIARMPRLAGSALARLALDGDPDRFGGVHMEAALIDVDAPGHVPPVEGWTEDQLARVPADLSSAMGWYRTPNGLRLVFLPRDPVPVLLGDSYLGQLAARLKGAGLDVDPSTSQVLRLQRAPRALRRDLPRDFSKLAPLEWHPARLDVRKASSCGPVVVHTGAMPFVQHGLGKTDFKRLGRTLGALEAEAVRNGTLACAPGLRHATLVRVALALASTFETNDPAIVYSILHPNAMRMFAGDTSGRDWQAELSRLAEWACAQVSGARQDAEAERAEAAEVAADTLGCAPSDVTNRLIVSTGATMFVYNEATGRYDLPINHERELKAALVEACPRLAGDLPWTKASTADLLRDHGLLATDAAYTYTPRRPQYDPDERRLYIDAVTVSPDLAPRYHADVHAWLCALGGRDTSRLLDWLAAFPRLDRGLCALYLQGGRGIGKNMLALGLARLYSKSSEVVEYKDIAATFQEKLKKTPVVWADEKASDGKSDSAVFRALVGNTGTQARQKYADNVTIVGYPRLIVTANNADAFRIREELDRADIDAITQRVGYIMADDAAAYATLDRLATEQGHVKQGRPNHREMTERWVAGGAIAEHVLWLQANRDFVPGYRYLVDGWESDWTRALGLKAGRAPDVALAMVAAIEEDRRTDAVRWFGGHVYVSATELLRDWAQVVPGGERSTRPPTINALIKTLKALSSDAAGRRMDLRFKPGDKRAQSTYYAIPSEAVARMAEEFNIGDPHFILDAASRADERTSTAFIADEPPDADMRRRDMHMAAARPTSILE